MVRVTPPAGVVDEHLPATDRVSKRDEHAQLVRDSLDTATILDHGGPPALRHDTIKRDRVRGFVIAGLAARRRVPFQQLDRIEHRPISGVVRPERKRAEQRGEHASVVRGVRGSQHRPHSLVEDSFLRPRLTNQVTQRSFIDDGVHNVTDGAVGMLDRDLGDPEQDLFLPANPAEIGDQFTFNASIRVGVDLVD